MSEVPADEPLSDLDALLWAVDDPRHRTTIAALARVDGRVDHDELGRRVDRTSRAVPRLRQRVTADASGRAMWTTDPAFDPDRHLDVVTVPDSSDDALARLVRDRVAQPLDRERPLWELTLVEGPPGDDCALLVTAHHAISDGVGGVAMMAALFDLDLDPDLDPDLGPGIAVEPVSREQSRQDPPPSITDRAWRLGETLGAAYRVLRPREGEAVVAPARSAELDLRFLSLDLDDMRAAGARVGGTINTAFLTAVAIGLADHAAMTGRTPLRIGVPVSTRTHDCETGNHWSPTRIDVTLAAGAEPDSVAARLVADSARLRGDPIHELLPLAAAGLRLLPEQAAAAVFRAVSAGADVAASNVPGCPFPLRLCGRPVRELIPFGPLSGTAVNVTLLSYAGVAHIGIASDPAAITDPDALARDLRHAFTAVVKGS